MSDSVQVGQHVWVYVPLDMREPASGIVSKISERWIWVKDGEKYVGPDWWTALSPNQVFAKREEAFARYLLLLRWKRDMLDAKIRAVEQEIKALEGMA